MGIRLRELELIHFANIYTGIGATHLRIDFSKLLNILCVIIGENGRGKTSLLSYMTPFAGIGNIEVRDNNALILKGKQGYKRIVIEDDGSHIYTIQHYYQPEKNDKFSIKSYIALDGEELNTNGNVTSFIVLVKKFLGIEPDYLKLIRVGDNVQGLIKSKDTERKVFMGKLLEDVDVYLRQNKKMTKISAGVKAIMGHVTDGITKTGITDEDEAEKTLIHIQDDIAKSGKEREKLVDMRSRLQYEIEALNFPVDGKHQIRDLEHKVSKFEKVKSGLDSSVTSATVAVEIAQLEKEIIEAKSEQEAIRSRIEYVLNDIDHANNRYLSLKLDLEKEEKRLNIITMRSHVASLQIKVNETYESRFDEEKVQITKELYDEFVQFIQRMQKHLDRAYEFGKSVVSKVVEYMENRRDIQAMITASLLSLDASNHASKMSILDKLIDKYAGQSYNCPEKDGCPYKRLHNELLVIKDTTPVSDVVEDEEYYYAMKAAHEILQEFIHDMLDVADRILKKLPDVLQDFFTMDVLFDNIRNLRPIYDEKLVNHWGSFITDLSNYNKLVDALNTEKEHLKLLEDSSKEGFLRDHLEIEKTVLENYIELKDELTTNLDDMSTKISSLEQKLSDLSTTKDALELYEDTKSNLQELEEKLNKDASLKVSLDSVDKEIAVIDFRIKKQTMDERLLMESLGRYRRLNRELKAYSKVYDMYDHLKFASSNRTGLPLFSIDLYLQDTVNIANELLDIVYDGKKYLLPFSITDDQFRMPFVNNGIEIPDVSLASQGEQSFFNMAISSALRAQCMETYNIALLDEVDSVFDDTNRQKIIPVLEKQFEISNVQQAFLVTHNKMFDQYPTDVINLDDPDKSSIPVKCS